VFPRKRRRVETDGWLGMLRNQIRVTFSVGMQIGV
jgi:hypothetical protein